MNTDTPPVEDTFPLTLSETSAWNLRGVFTPGILIDWPEEATAQIEADRIVRTLRMKIDAAILRMIDEKIPQVEIPCTSQEAWAIDSTVRFDALNGPGGDILVQISRGLWHLDIGQHMTNLMPGKAKTETVEGHEELYDHLPATLTPEHIEQARQALEEERPSKMVALPADAATLLEAWQRLSEGFASEVGSEATLTIDDVMNTPLSLLGTTPPYQLPLL